MVLNNTGAPGVRFQHQLLKEGRTGGLNAYPFSALVNGVNVTVDPRLGSGTFSVQVDVTSGTVILDGETVNTPTINNLSIEGNLQKAKGGFGVHIVPRRLVQVVVDSDTPPTTRADGSPLVEGDYYLHVTSVQYGANGEPYHVGKTPFVYKYVNGTWIADDASTFGPPVQKGQQNLLRFGEVLPSVSSAATNNPNFSSTPEPVVYYPTGYSPNVAQPAHGVAREDGSLRVADIDLHLVELPYVGSVTLVSGSATATVPAHVATSLRWLKNAAGGSFGTNFPISGTGIPTSTTLADVHATNNTITLSANATANTNNSVFTVSHASATYAIASTSVVKKTTNIINS